MIRHLFNGAALSAVAVSKAEGEGGGEGAEERRMELMVWKRVRREM